MPGHLSQEAQEAQQGVTVAGGQQEQQQLQGLQLCWSLHAWEERLLVRVPPPQQPGCCPTPHLTACRTQQGLC